jgi:hypothetical protein
VIFVSKGKYMEHAAAVAHDRYFLEFLRTRSKDEWLRVIVCVCVFSGAGRINYQIDTGTRTDTIFSAAFVDLSVIVVVVDVTPPY